MNKQDRPGQKQAQTELQTPSAVPSKSQTARIRYRIQQFARGFRAKIDADEQAAALLLLPETARSLFTAMPSDAQRHSLNVLATLHSVSYNDSDLAAAALLHDMGKIAAQEAGVSINLWMRGPLVMTEAIAPDFLRTQARPEHNTGWRYAIHVQLDHPAIGADRARDAGCSELTCWLIAHHQDSLDAEPSPGRDKSTPEKRQADEYRQQLLAALQWADGLN